MGSSSKSHDRKRKRSSAESEKPAPEEKPTMNMPNYSDDDDDDDSSDDEKTSFAPAAKSGDADEEMKDADNVLEEEQVDAKYANFYKRFQQAARAIPLAAYNVEREDGQTFDQVRALPLDAEDDVDAEVREALQRKEATVVPADLVPLPLPSNAGGEEGTEQEQWLLKRQQKKEAAAAATAIPKWLSAPTHIATEVKIPFSQIEGLSQRMKDNLNSLNFKDAFAVQAAVLPPLLADVHSLAPDTRPDILVNAATGSGKTLAYSIPIVEGLAKRVIPQIRALVLLPTKPLIQQVRSVMEHLAKGTSLRVVALRSERKFKEEQNLLTKTVPDILIATPGRLVDHIRSTPGFTLSHLQYMVVDEADRLLNQSFQEWVDVVINAIEPAGAGAGAGSELAPMYARWRRTAQKLIFSATLTRDPEKMANLRIRNPQVYVVGGVDANQGADENDRKEFMVPPTLTERLVPIRQATIKPLRLMQMLLTQKEKITSYVLVFVKSNEAAARLARLLTIIDEEVFHSGLRIERCSGEVEASLRRKTLRAFADGKIDVLVCTDLIARGIDISQIRHVVNYDLPPGKREYVHRVGRTARAGESGTAWSFACDPQEHKYFWGAIANRIYREDGKEVERFNLEGEIEPEGTREFYRQEDGYKVALERLESEVYNKK